MTQVYRYKAKEASGRTARGKLEAASRAEALNALRRRRLTPLALAPTLADSAGRSGRLTDRAARDLTRTIAQLLRSGLSLAQALRFATDELQGEAANAARRLQEAAERGERPSTALAQFAGAQARLLAGVMLAGETSGKMAEALEMAAASFGRAAEMRGRIATSMIYPAFVVLATLATLTIFVFFVVPTLAGAFEGSEDQLPKSTRDLLAATAWLKANGLLVAVFVLAVGFVAWRTPRSNRWLRLCLDRVMASPAGLGIAARLDLSAFARLASLSLEAGVPGAGAFEAAAAGVRGEGLRRRLSEAAAAIRLGERPSDAVERLARPPRTLTRLMQVGEETGELGASLNQAAELLAGEAEQRIQRLGAVAGPIITIVLGGLVASVVVSLFLGLLAMSEMAG